MKRTGTRLAVASCAVALGAMLTAPASMASDGSASAPPRVHIGQLSGPVVGPEGTSLYWLDVTAGDRDGVITEVTVEWSSDDFHSVVFADRSCWLEPASPGDTVTMRIPATLPGPGSYRVRVHADSIASCDAPGEMQQGPAKQRRFRVTG